MQVHRELATVFLVKDIFTTDWDSYFEMETGATPFLTEQDWAFWKGSERKVFKLHGSISNPGSVVATTEDYQRCYRSLNRGLVGATLKTMLATKTVVFVGYSFGDADFNAVYALIKRLMKDILPKAFVVTLDDGPAPDLLSGAHVLRTDAAFFVEELKARLPAEEFIADDRHVDADRMAALVALVHEEMLDTVSLDEHPEVVFTAAYQDGLIHAFEHQAANRKTGRYSHTCDVERLVRAYEEIRREHRRTRRYPDAAYAEGYQNGLLFVLLDDDDRRGLPLYFLFGCRDRLTTLEEYLAAAVDAPTLHKTAYRQAVKLAQGYAAAGTVAHHPPVLGTGRRDDSTPR